MGADWDNEKEYINKNISDIAHEIREMRNDITELKQFKGTIFGIVLAVSALISLGVSVIVVLIDK